MKKLFTVALFMVVTMATAFSQSTLQEAKIQTSAICEMCQNRIEKGLSRDKGIKTTALDLDTKVLTVSYDPAVTSLDKIRENVASTGYDADDVKAEDKSYNKLPSCCRKKETKVNN